jgi:hypothetical protein
VPNGHNSSKINVSVATNDQLCNTLALLLVRLEPRPQSQPKTNSLSSVSQPQINYLHPIPPLHEAKRVSTSHRFQRRRYRISIKKSTRARGCGPRPEPEAASIFRVTRPRIDAVDRVFHLVLCPAVHDVRAVCCDIHQKFTMVSQPRNPQNIGFCFKIALTRMLIRQ